MALNHLTSRRSSKIVEHHGSAEERPTWSSSIEGLCDVSNLVVGAALFLSPWILGFGANSPNVPTQSAGVIGAAIAILAVAALLGFEVWEEWLIQFFAVCAMAAPWILDFEGASVMFVHLVAGAASFLLATARLVLMRRSG